MACLGNLLTHYNYQLAGVRVVQRDLQLEIEITTPEQAADLHVIADLRETGNWLPPNSPFRDSREARLFAGPLPFTFDHEPETDSMILIEGVRQKWKPRLVRVNVLENSFLRQFTSYDPILASAFYVRDIPYLWKRGVREQLAPSII